MSELLKNNDAYDNDDDEEMEDGEELDVSKGEDAIDDDEDVDVDDERIYGSGNDGETPLLKDTSISVHPKAAVNYTDAPFTQDSALTDGMHPEYTQDTLEPEYDEEGDDDDDDDAEDEQRDNVDNQLPVTGDEVVDEPKDTQQNDEDTSLDEVDPGEDTGKEDVKLEEESETKIETASSKSNQTKPEVSSYSTRGRTHEENNFDRLAAVGDLLSLGASHRDATTAVLLQSPETKGRESFLSDSLTDEERRTRTRYLPSVDGMHALRKQEIKNDLVLARSTLSSSGISEKIARSTKRKNPDDELSGMEVADSAAMSSEEAAPSADDDKGVGGIVPKTVEIGSTTLNIPSTAFVAPSLESSTKKATPREVDVVVAFNPPRPPESIGAKKKHRMLRWERRPSDIDSDLSSYRKTVQKTREELKSAEGELNRIRVVDNQLRRHFLQHVQLMKAETEAVSDEVATIQQECIDMSDLPNSRTRTRGAFKGSNAMKDVLYALRAKGKEMESKGLSGTQLPLSNSNIRGAGGVTTSSFIDWDRTTKIEASRLAEPWIVPGEKVKTPYGTGIVHSVYGPSSVNITELPNYDLFPKPNSAIFSADTSDAMEVEESENQSVSSKKKVPKMGKKIDYAESITTLVNMIAPRVAVRLPFGVGFFNLVSLTSEDDPSTHTDDQLAKRWLGIAETAASFGSTVSVSAMTNIISAVKNDESAAERSMDIEKAADVVDTNKIITNSLVSFGSAMLPTAVGRGTNLHKASLLELDKAVNTVFFNGHGVLGNKDNLGVPNEVRKLEDQRQEHLNLQAKVLQLRNQLYRQRRIRILNDRTYLASQERASKVESLVAEMRMDLKSLKSRLDLEIRELGISEEQAESILKAFYMSQDSQLTGEVSPPSRSSRFSQANDINVDHDMPMGTETAPDTDASMTVAEQ